MHNNFNLIVCRLSQQIDSYNAKEDGVDIAIYKDIYLYLNR